jgi:translation initiation factor 1
MSKKKRKDVIYSTNPDFEYHYEGELQESETLPPEHQNLKIKRERKGRGGKEVSIVSGFSGTEADLKSLAKIIKQGCGVGGSVKDREIIIQGEQRNKILEILTREGYKAKIAGG